jgi:CRP/FNR family transcriptional regulator
MIKEKLKRFHLFANLSDDELSKLSEIVKEKSFNKGDMIFFDTEPYIGFYIVNIGSVKIYKVSKEGREHILHIISDGNSFAEVPLFENYNKINEDEFRYPANAMALEESTQVIRIPGREFIELINRNPEITMKMLSGFAKRLRTLTRHIEEITLKDVTKRVAGYIITEYDKKPGNGEQMIELNISKNDLASYLGTIIETLSRTFKKLQDQGIIMVESKSIIIKDIEKLKKVAL